MNEGLLNTPVNIIMVSWAVVLNEKSENEFSFLVLISLTLLLLLCILSGIPVRRSNQLSYEATDIGIGSFVCSNEPVTNEFEVIY